MKETKNQIYSAMVVYGLLTYEDGAVFIPNKELMDKYNELLLTNDSLGYVHRLAKVSEKRLVKGRNIKERYWEWGSVITKRRKSMGVRLL